MNTLIKYSVVLRIIKGYLLSLSARGFFRPTLFRCKRLLIKTGAKNEPILNERGGIAYGKPFVVYQ
jgi:hypothetical protein